MDIHASHPSSIARLFSCGRPQYFHKNEVIIRATETPLGVYLITSGWVRICTVCPDGEPNIISTLYQGDIFPISWAVTGITQPSSFVANSKTNVIRISRNDFLKQISSDSRAAQSVMQLLAQRTRGFTEAQDNLHFRSAKQRIAYRLLTLAHMFGQETDDGLLINTPVTNEYIARSSNMTRETASREINKIIKNGIVTASKGKYTIANIAALQAITSSHKIISDKIL